MTGPGDAPHTPLPIQNRAGLAAIGYRVGVHAAFRETMLDRLLRLRGLNAHDPSDITTALVDAFAATAEIVSFYQERIANESYLRTATERRSLVELGRLIDYRPRPGVAASAYLAFTLETAPATLSDRLVESLGARGWLKRKNTRAMRRLRAIIERGEQRGDRVTVAAG